MSSKALSMKRSLPDAAKTADGVVSKKSRAMSSGPAAASSDWQLSLNDLEPGWREALLAEERKPYFTRLSKFVTAQYASKRIFPPRQKIFEAFRLCPYDKVRVVIIGQDPYHGPGQAHGLCFSVEQGVRVPPSLRNVYKELNTSAGIPICPHGNLEKWAKQGILLLNTVLTVEAHKANSHKKHGWELFTDAVIRKLASEQKDLVFMLWGNPAKLKASCVDKRKHKILSSSHPSPLGATKTSSPFIGSNMFNKCNEALRASDQGPPIDWNPR